LRDQATEPFPVPLTDVNTVQGFLLVAVQVAVAAPLPLSTTAALSPGAVVAPSKTVAEREPGVTRTVSGAFFAAASELSGAITPLPAEVVLHAAAKAAPRARIID